MSTDNVTHAQDSSTTHKPKKATSAFFRFMGERRPVIQQEQPDLKCKDISKLLGNEWRELSEERKMVYKQQYVEEKAELEKNQVFVKNTRKKNVNRHYDSSDDEDRSELTDQVNNLTDQVRNLTDQVDDLRNIVKFLEREIHSMKDQPAEDPKKTSAQELHGALVAAENEVGK